MQIRDINSQIDEARQCHSVLIGHWLTWANLQFDKHLDAATLLELKALKAELEERQKEAERRFLGVSAGDFG